MRGAATAVITTTAMLLDRATGLLDRAVRVAVTLMLTAIFALLITQVLLRYVIFVPLAWIEELSTILAAYLTLWGASACLRAGSHVLVDTLYRALPELLRRAVTVLVYALLLYFCWGLHVGGERLALLGAREISDSGYFYQYWPRMALSTGAALIAVQTVNLLVQEIAGWLTGVPYWGGVRRATDAVE
jgi:TRAP-type transport system small permease protein